MGVNLDDCRELLEDLGPHAGEVLRASWQEAARAFSARGLDAYLEGARALHALGRGPEPVAAYLHAAPTVAHFTWKLDPPARDSPPSGAATTIASPFTTVNVSETTPV